MCAFAPPKASVKYFWDLGYRTLDLVFKVRHSCESRNPERMDCREAKASRNDRDCHRERKRGDLYNKNNLSMRASCKKNPYCIAACGKRTRADIALTPNHKKKIRQQDRMKQKDNDYRYDIGRCLLKSLIYGLKEAQFLLRQYLFEFF